LDYDGLPLWRRQLNTLTSLEPAELFISAAPGLELPAGPWKILYDQSPGLGPLAGLVAALRAITAERLVVLAVDMPAVTSEFLRLLLAEAGTEGGIIPELDGFYQGTVAIYPRNILPACEQTLAGHDRSLQRLVRHGLAENLIRIHPVSKAERHLFLNLNAPSDLSSDTG
jgi:molybdopterin-guanine dinucleotide biosynthesis protein A